jgi:hypothetical protein
MDDLKTKQKTFVVEFRESITLRDNIKIDAFAEFTKKFFIQIISGWFPSIRMDLSPQGVQKLRVIDRKNNFYKEKVIDYKTERVIRDIEEKLSDHK